MLITAEFIKKLDRGLYDNDASHPGNSLFIKHGDSNSLKGVDPSSINGTLLVDQNSQTFVACTPDEILPEQKRKANERTVGRRQRFFVGE